MASPFHGKCYHYPTPSHGLQAIGVCEVMGGLWAVCWIITGGGRHRVKTHHLPTMTKPEILQGYLDQWAALRKLAEVQG